ncbi:PA14 domain-containing protein [Peribacillus muralis]|uniref:beta-xylosidase family glycoside hydrolase n=1 Tax=Peribacillus muralis TaxID=264697 RepID=UPI00070F9219|nr:PA14 domain-containing protein [Peribacillus muralis]
MKKTLMGCLFVSSIMIGGVNGSSVSAAGDADNENHGLKGEYYTSTKAGAFDFNQLKTTIMDYNIDFADLNPALQNFTGQSDAAAVRWTGKLVPEHSEDYTFYMKGDNGFRVWIDGKLAIDFWEDKWDVEQKSQAISLEAGKEYDIKIEYFEHEGGANLKMFWSSASVPKQIIPSSAFYLPEDYVRDETVQSAQVLEDGKQVELTFANPLDKLPRNLDEHVAIKLNGRDWEIENIAFKQNSKSTVVIHTKQPIYERTGNQVLITYDGKGALRSEGKDVPAFLNRVENHSQFNIETPWAAKVSKDNVLPEYPRPQLAREDWMNLNGEWEFQSAAEGDELPTGKKLKEKILVPFPVESALSDVERLEDHMWYKRDFTLPDKWKGDHIKLNFGAVDWKSTLYVNGEKVGTHTGGYDAFSYDITKYLVKGKNELILEVHDPTGGGQARGKQTTVPEGIWYTPTSGIWQTVWIEPVPKANIASLKTTPEIDSEQLKLKVKADGVSNETVEAIVYKKGKKVSTVTGKVGKEFTVPVPDARLWSTKDPFLYDLEVRLKKKGKIVDTVKSYFGMREITIGKVDGKLRPLINGEFVFQMGPLDQGYWPDGNYTAPTDEALKFDIKKTKDLGFNMIRKHIKVEPARWYYWADKMGMIVWQDMPSLEGSSAGGRATADERKQFEHEFKEMIQEKYNHPSIVQWTVFNEGWGQYDTVRLTNWVKGLDPTRFVTNASGWTDHPVGDVIDWHTYPNPKSPNVEEDRIAVIGEYGGLGLDAPGHEWGTSGWSYAMQSDKDEITDTYIEYIESLKGYVHGNGLSGAVYTQTTDVEGELNGLLTYDRKVTKMDAKRVAEANQSLIKSASPKYVLKEEIDETKAVLKNAKMGSTPGTYPNTAIFFLKKSIKNAEAVYDNTKSTSEEFFKAADQLKKDIQSFKYEVNSPIAKKAKVDQFEGEVLDKKWSVFNESPANWSLKENPGHLTITSQPGDSFQDSNTLSNLFLQKAPAGDFEITTKVNASNRNNHEQAGLYVWQDQDNYVRLGHVWDNGLKLETAKEEAMKYSKAPNSAAHPGDDTLFLKIKKVGNVYSSYYWVNGKWEKAADPITAKLTNVKVGLYAASPASGKNVKANFDYFTVQEVK